MARNYERKLSRDSELAAEKSRSARDVASDYPPPGNLDRRRSCEQDLKRFYETYFATAFPLPWSKDHLKVISRLEECAMLGGLFALAMPRASGKTTMVERAAIWAILYGHRKYVCIVGATREHATAILQSIKAELLGNDLLAEDFRQVTHCVRKLEGNARKANGQLFDGQQTGIVWGSASVVLPTVPDHACDGVNVSGSVFAARPLLGALRGQKQRLVTGEIIRPDLVLLDDPQTRESAINPDQSSKREAVIRGDVLGMAGHGMPIAAVMPCTVIRKGDLSDRFLDRDKYPAWQGERTKFVLSWPTDVKMWDRYHQIRNEAMRHGGDISEATRFYAQNRSQMDAGGETSWPFRYEEGELSAIQHAQNKLADLGSAAFSAEYQNEPEVAESDAPGMLTADQIAEKVGGVSRGIIPIRCTLLTAFVDVHDALLYYAVCAWTHGFDGHIVDYGTYPKQPLSIFTLRKASPTLADVAPGAGREGAIRAGLDRLCADLCGREWQREDGTGLRIGKCLVDSGYVPDLVREFCRRSVVAQVLLPSRGVGVGATSNPMSDWSPKSGERSGTNWIISPTPDRSGLNVRFDANSWKTFVQARLAVPIGDSGSLSLYGSKAMEHRQIAEHLVAETATLVAANGRSVLEWSVQPGRPDNHWLDCVVGCAVAASILGAKLGETAQPKAAPKLSWREMQERQRLKRAQQRGMMG